MSTMIQLAISPASSRAQRCTVTASLNVLLSSSSLVTAVIMSIRRVTEAVLSTAASSSANAASRSARASAPGRPAARRSASRRPASSAESV